MSSLLPGIGRGERPDPEHPTLQERPRALAERRARWEVRAAQWRAHEIAESVFGRVASSSLTGIRREGRMRGLMSLEVPFTNLRTYRAREDRFLAAVHADPVLSRIPLVYILGPEAA